MGAPPTTDLPAMTSSPSPVRLQLVPTAPPASAAASAFSPQPLPTWWPGDGDALGRVLGHLLRAEMAALRPSGWPLPPGGWQADLTWADDLGADSLDLLALSTTVCEFFDLQDLACIERLHREARVAGWLNVTRQALARQAADPGLPQRLRFRAPGGTESSQAYAHALADLWQEAQSWVELLGPVRRIVTVLAAHRLDGYLFGVGLPLALAARPGQAVTVLDLHGLPAAAVAGRLAEGDVLVGSVEHWQALARLTGPWPSGLVGVVVGVSAAAPCPDAVSEALMAPGRLSRLLQVYGSTASSGVAWREWPAPAFSLHSFWSRAPALAGQPAALQRQAWPQPVLAAESLQWLDARHFLLGPHEDAGARAVQPTPASLSPGLARPPGLNGEDATA